MTASGPLFKLGAPALEVGLPFTYPDIWAVEPLSNGSNRLIVAPSHAQVELLIALLQAIPEPFGLLYVLVITRGSASPGRYQSTDPLSRHDTERLLRDLAHFFEQDGRHHLWVCSTTSPAMLIYDRHNVLYAYGPLDAWKHQLVTHGLVEVPSIDIPKPHSHHYHAQLDSEEERLLNSLPWLRTPLSEADDE